MQVDQSFIIYQQIINQLCLIPCVVGISLKALLGLFYNAVSAQIILKTFFIRFAVMFLEFCYTDC